MRYTILKPCNNNVLGVVNQQGVQHILMGNGIGFGAKAGRLFTKYADVTASFILEDNGNLQSFQKLADDVDEGLMLLIEQQLEAIQSALNVQFNENIHVTLLDHINFALYRYSKGLSFKNPFDEELSIIYEQEYALASGLISRVNSYCNVRLPRDEIGIVAIHLHSALQNEELMEARRKTDLVEMTISRLCENFEVQFDRRSLSYQRLLIHTKLAFERILAGKVIGCGLADYIMSNYAEPYRRIEAIMQQIGNENGLSIPQSEICYLVLHFMRVEEERQSQAGGKQSAQETSCLKRLRLRSE